jgi:hypothetical protein
MDETDARIHDFDLDEPDGETAGMYPVARSYAKATGVHSHIHCRLRRPRWSADRRRTVSALHAAVPMTSGLL